MPHPHAPCRSRLWPRFAVLASVGLLAAGCADSARFDSSPYASNTRPQGDVTGSVNPPPANRVVAQPLPAPARPGTVAVNGGVTNGAEPLVAYRPATRSDITGSGPAHHAPPAPAGHWTWDGGAAVTVGQGQTLDQIAHKYGVPASAIMQVNKMRSAADMRPGQRLVIPRYVSSAAPAPHAAPPRAAASVYTVAPGDTMMSIAHRHGVKLSALAKANKMNAFGKISIGMRLTIPSGGKTVLAQNHAPAPKPAPPVASEAVSSVPVEKANIAKSDVHVGEPAKVAEPAGAMPSFRWPVTGRISSKFGERVNGAVNDGINLAVPMGTPVKAADDGVVAYAGNELKGYGNLVLIRHANGYVSAYANASELLVKKGDTVKRGQVIAHAGQTGNVSAPQLHFEIRKGSVPVDPTKYLNGA